MQHQILAENLTKDICAPVSKLKTKLLEQLTSLRAQTKDAEKVVVDLEFSYRQAQERYDRAYMNACRHVALCLEIGLPLPILTTVHI